MCAPSMFRWTAQTFAGYLVCQLAHRQNDFGKNLFAVVSGRLFSRFIVMSIQPVLVLSHQNLLSHIACFVDGDDLFALHATSKPMITAVESGRAAWHAFAGRLLKSILYYRSLRGLHILTRGGPWPFGVCRPRACFMQTSGHACAQSQCTYCEMYHNDVRYCLKQFHELPFAHAFLWIKAWRAHVDSAKSDLRREPVCRFKECQHDQI